MHLRVLLVEERADVREALEQSLAEQKARWDMTIAATAEEALTVLADSQIDVAVFDTDHDPEGAELLAAAIRERYPETARVVMARSVEQARPHRLASGNDLYIAKPCPKDAFVSTIERAAAVHGILWKEAHDLTLTDIKEILVDFFSAEILHQRLGLDEVPAKIRPHLHPSLLEKLEANRGQIEASAESPAAGGPAFNSWLDKE